MHSCDSSYARSGKRTDELRRTTLSDKALQEIGLQSNDDPKYSNSPLFALPRALEQARVSNTIPLTGFLEPVVVPRFDPYRSTVISPDHMLCGVAINTITAAFSLLRTKEYRKLVDRRICDALNRNSLIPQDRIYNESGKGKSLYSTSMSGTFCILLVADAVLRGVVLEMVVQGPVPACFISVVELVTILRRLIAMTYWIPDIEIDGIGAMNDVNAEDGTRHIQKLESCALAYVKKCNNICRLSKAARDQLDKPNVHRLVSFTRIRIGVWLLMGQICLNVSGKCKLGMGRAQAWQVVV